MMKYNKLMMKYNKLMIIATIALILNLSGCLMRTNQGKEIEKLSKPFYESMEAFDNRPIFKKLTELVIDSASDENLLQIVFDNLMEKLPSDYNKWYKKVMSWNKSRQAIYMIWCLEGEVNNGGYNQFYFNSSGEFYKHLPDALRLVGAHKFADITERANAVYEKEYEQITKYQDGTMEGFMKSYEDNPLSVFDDEFYKLNENGDLGKIQIAYIRTHKQDFIDK